MESLDLSSARVVIEGRPAYLLITERGPLTSVRDVQRYAAFVESVAQRRARSAVLIDARLGDPGARSAEVRDAFWQWLVSGRVIFRVAWVLPAELAVAQVNMGSSRRAPVRAFPTAQEAHRWLTAGGVATAPTIPVIPAAAAPRSSTREAVDRVVRAAAPPGARMPSPGGEERLARTPRERDAGDPPSDPLIPRIIASRLRESETPSGATPLAAIRPSQVAIPRAELERMRSSAPPAAPDDERVVLRSDVVARRPTLDGFELEIELTGSGEES